MHVFLFFLVFLFFCLVCFSLFFLSLCSYLHSFFFSNFLLLQLQIGVSECSALSGLVPRLILPEASLCGSLAWGLACWHQGGPRASATRQGAGANCALTMSPRPSQGPVRFGLGCPWMRGIPFGSLSNKPAPSGGGTWQEPRRCRRDRRRKNNSDTQKIR